MRGPVAPVDTTPSTPAGASKTGRFQILSLDGGGLRGIFAASALAQLESDFDTKVIDHFDLVSGTSTGGLIALGLAAGQSPQDILDFYVERGRTIFFPISRLARLQRIRRPYRAEPLRAALDEILGDRTLGDSPVRLAIPSFDQTSNDVYLFRTPRTRTLSQCYAVTLNKGSG